jgi:hypothetical protein
MYFFLDINDRIDGNIVIPGDLFKLAFEGNEQFVGNKIDLSSLRGDLKFYREVGLGFSRNFTDKLRLGIKAKVLFGIASVSIDNNSLGITVNSDYTHTLDADLMVNFSAPLNVVLDSVNHIKDIEFDSTRFNGSSKIIDYLLETQNLGFGLDIGAEYSFSDRLKISASITDLGYIRWKKDVTNLKAESQFLFSGVNLLDVYN